MAEEHRLKLDPDVARRVGASMAAFADAWTADIAQLRSAEAELAETERARDAAIDRAGNLQDDLRAARQENADLIRRNSYLEAQIQTLYEKSADAKDVMESLASKAVAVARDAPAVEPRPQWRDPEKNPPGEEHAAPAFLRPSPAGARVPMNEFQRAAE